MYIIMATQATSPQSKFISEAMLIPRGLQSSIKHVTIEGRNQPGCVPIACVLKPSHL